MRHVLALLAAALLTSAQALPAVAQEAASAHQDSSAHVALVEAINSGVNADALFGRSIAQLRIALTSESTEMVELEKLMPGTIDAMLQAMSPAMRKHGERVTGEYQRNLIDVLAANLTSDEARDAADFYASPLGRKVMAQVQANYSVTAVASEAIREGEDEPISSEAISRDSARTTAAAMQGLTPADIAAINARMKGRSWVAKFQTIRPKMLELRTAMENAPMLPEDEAAMGAAVEAVINERMAKLN